MIKVGMGDNHMRNIFWSTSHHCQLLNKRIAFGYFFLAPLVGFALKSLVGQQLNRQWVAAIAFTMLIFITGINEAQWQFHTWPNTTSLVATMQTQVPPVVGRYLCDDLEIIRYRFEGIIAPYHSPILNMTRQITSTTSDSTPIRQRSTIIISISSNSGLGLILPSNSTS